MSDKQLAGAQKVAHWLDRRYIDPLLGLVLPGLGDGASAAFSFYLIGLAVKARIPAATLARMLLNTAVDMLFGAVPILGDAFDFVFRANERNVRLFEKALTSERRTRPGDIVFLVVAALVFLAALALPIALIVWSVRNFDRLPVGRLFGSGG